MPKLITEKINIKMKHMSYKVDRHEVNKLNTVITCINVYKIGRQLKGNLPGNFESNWCGIGTDVCDPKFRK